VAVQLLSEGYDRTLALLGEMGVRDRMVGAPGRDALWREGRPHPLRYGSIPSMVASGALPTRLKLRMGLRYVPFLERHARALDLNAPERAAAAGLGEESIAVWGREHLGEEFVEWLAYPLLSAYYGVTPEETSAALFHALARSGMGVEVVGARGGFGELAAAMAASLENRRVEIRTDSPVRALEAAAGGVRVLLEGESVEHERVVLAIPPGPAAALLPSVELLEGIAVRATASLVLSTRIPIATGWFGLSIPRTEPAGETLAAVCVQGEKGTDVVGPGGGALVLVPAPGTGERWAGSSAGLALEEGMAALRQVMPAAAAEVEEARLVRLPDAVWAPTPGHFRRVAAFRQESLPSWLALAGDYLVTPTVEGAVRSGLSAADRVVRLSEAG
jgi:oxygen-dependent protoporphyrinogen oxidase